MTSRKQKPLILATASFLAAMPAIAQQSEPAPASPAAEQGVKPASPNPPQLLEKDQQATANDILTESAGSASNCYRGFHTSFDYDITGSALTAIGRKVIEPGGLCDQYREYSAGMPIEIGVPVLPGVSVNIDKLCKMVQRPPCPEPSAGHTENQDQAKK